MSILKNAGMLASAPPPSQLSVSSTADTGLTIGSAAIGVGYPTGLAQQQALHNQTAYQELYAQQQRYEMQMMRANEKMRRMVDVSDDEGRKIMIAIRLRLDEGDIFPFEHLSSARTSDKVYVFVVQNETPVTLEDDIALFPSDTLITQLRLLMK